MHHIYPLSKGDPLCPLGFHPQVRWPTRCKRCFRDYKEHGGKKKSGEIFQKDDSTASTPNLNVWNSSKIETNKRSWASSSNLSNEGDKASDRSKNNNAQESVSWISTPDLVQLQEDAQANIPTVSLTLHKRKQQPIKAYRTVSDSVLKADKAVFDRNDDLATRAKRLQAIKESNREAEKRKRIQIKEVKTTGDSDSSNDVQFLIQVKTTSIKDDIDDDIVSNAGTETTDTTLVNDSADNELQEQIESLKQELESTKTKCERLEREKSDLLLRRLAAMETSTSKTTASEVLKLQQKCNELQSQLEDMKDDRRSLNFRVKELEEELKLRPTAQAAQKAMDELRSKLLAAETLCEELMDENEDMKKELRDLEEEMEEMQDNFREDQADEYSSLRKELEQTTKNCRILSFKLRKSERRVEQLEMQKTEVEKKFNEVSGGSENINKIRLIEQQLQEYKDTNSRLQKELEEANSKLNKVEEGSNKKKPVKLGSIPKMASTEGKVSRDSLTRGGSQEDPAVLLRDLQDSMEREADLREQLKFAEEEAQNLRKKVSRIEDDNESLVLQLKKMATKTKNRKLSPTSRHNSDFSNNKDGAPDNDDPTELKLLLELNEQETKVLRKKVEELEAEGEASKKKIKDLLEKLNQHKKIESLQKKEAVIDLKKGRSKDIQKKQVCEVDQRSHSLQKQLETIEQEATVLRSKIQDLEGENEKLSAENKRLQLFYSSKTSKTDKVLDPYIDRIAELEEELNKVHEKITKNSETDKLQLKLDQLESENKRLAEKLEHLKDESITHFLNRIPKNPGSITSKIQLKNMVNELENEIGDLVLALKRTTDEKNSLEEEIKRFKGDKNLIDYEKPLDKLKFQSKADKQFNNSSQTSKTLAEETKILKEEKDRIQKEIQKMSEEKNNLQKEIDNLSSYRNQNSYQGTNNDMVKEIDELKRKLKSKEDEILKLTSELGDLKRSIKEQTASAKQTSEVEQKILKLEKEAKRKEKTLTELLRNIETKLVEEQNKLNDKDRELNEFVKKSVNEKESFSTKMSELDREISHLNSQLDGKSNKIKELESNLSKEKEKHSREISLLKTANASEIECVKSELSKSTSSVGELQAKLDGLTREKAQLDKKTKTLEENFSKERSKLEAKIGELEIDLQNERKKMELMKANQEKEYKNRTAELNTLKSKIKTLELNSNVGNKKISEVKIEYQEKIDKMDAMVAAAKADYSKLTAKYEILEEEHVATKAKLIMEKESLSNQISSLKDELKSTNKELQTLRETYNRDKDAWIREKLSLQERLKGKEERIRNSMGNNIGLTSMKASLDEKLSELDQIKKEYDVISDQLEYMRKENDELKKKLDDYDKVSKVQRSISAESSAMEKEIKQLKAKLLTVEKSKRTDLTECKIRYESQMKHINEEIKTLQSQVTRFKRERDTFKHLLESAQKTIGDLKANPINRKDSRGSSSSLDELEESRTKIAALEQQISCMEDELSEARLEASKHKTELISERSSWEVKLSELHSRINELEEERLLSSGRTKVAGLKTKMELAWQKEREEQQRLLQETSTLARDLRQTLFEVERERDKERLEAKRKQDQLKKTIEEDQEATRRKLAELQYDLLELRDAHAKLRTTNEKLRREKERYEKEREEMKSVISTKKKQHQSEERKITVILNEIESLTRFLSDFQSTRETITETVEFKHTPTPPRRTKGPRSREASPNIENSISSSSKEDVSPQMSSVMQRLYEATAELKRYQRYAEDEKERDYIIKRTMGMRRATSSEHDDIPRLKMRQLKNGTGNALHRKSLSLEHTIPQDQSIWRTDNGSVSSMQSLEDASDVDTKWKRDSSMDSRLSGGSNQSDSGEKKKKKGFMKKLKTLTKSRSIDDQDPGHFPPPGTLSKPSSTSEVPSSHEDKGSKKDLRGRLTGIFKRAGSSSRSNSLERQGKQDTSSTQRPLMPSGSNSSIS
ncbi:myosin heavy chain, cardiac muscle isoform isoform X2 [Agrilus planipennis]|uniref:Myosin heavy chain, cardiac muscle isoform isoform X2 n=1 Tax=Agrilus planipennis TaxID=224129 RepID=A0A7F5R6A2_AGRPL|nr:myosin heavy chain, cardiac muscle isoform isoform X2 [Agrilus planipennis]